MFRTGAAAVALMFAGTIAFVAQADGWPSATRVFFTAFHPAVLFGLLPLALVLGGTITFLRKLIDR